MRDAVLDIGLQRWCGSRRPLLVYAAADDAERGGRERQDPLRRDHVVEIGDVVAVQVRQQHGGELARPGSCRGEPLHHAATASRRGT